MIVEVITSVVANLQEVAAEGTPTLRVATLRNYMARINSEDERYLLNLILSFQVSQALSRIPPVRFNTLPPRDIEKDIADWFMSERDPQEFRQMSYVTQSIIRFMASSKSLHLNTEKVAEVLEDFIDPYAWVAKHGQIYDEPSERCNFCGVGQKLHDKVCINCHTGLLSLVKNHHQEFQLDIEWETCGWVVKPETNHGPICIEDGAFVLERDGMHSFSYKLKATQNEPIQLNLDFPDYH